MQQAAQPAPPVRREQLRAFESLHDRPVERLIEQWQAEYEVEQHPVAVLMIAARRRLGVRRALARILRAAIRVSIELHYCALTDRHWARKTHA